MNLLPSRLLPISRALASHVKLFVLEERLRLRYGRSFVTKIHRRDEMFLFIYRSGSDNEADCMIEYLRSGESMMRVLERVLQDQGTSLAARHSLLEFACGWGRLTRFLVHRLDAPKLTASDIDPEAVRFVTSQMGVKGFTSAHDPTALLHGTQYDTIFVASLFSHLPPGRWEGWLKKLFALLQPEGLLIVSTHGPTPYAELHDKTDRLGESGFFFSPDNETLGRLSGNDYGTTYVRRDFVERTVAFEGLGTLDQHYPDLLYGWQDVYVIRKGTKGLSDLRAVPPR